MAVAAAGNYFDDVVKFKKEAIPDQEKSVCLDFVAGKNPQSKYLQVLQEIFTKQIKIKLGDIAVKTVLKEFVERKVHRQMKIFLKDKLGLREPIQPRLDLVGRAKWDPHFHGPAIFTRCFPQAKLCLPNFDEAYRHFRCVQSEKERTAYVEEAMEDPAFPEFVESGTRHERSYSHWGKRILPIHCHKKGDDLPCNEAAIGYDVCGPEREDVYKEQKAFLKSVKENQFVRMHMGETLIPERGMKNVSLLLDEAEKYCSSSKPLRIGHGTHISIADMIRMREKGYFIEACLSSNKRNAVLDKRSDYPLGVMLVLGVKVVIGTDGGALYSTDLALEYAYAERNLKKFQAKLQTSDDPIILPNGDQLTFKHLNLEGEEPLTYKKLGKLINPDILTVETLVKNAQELLSRCYPEQALTTKWYSNRAAMAVDSRG